MQRIARVAAATFVLAGGALHLDLWRDGYRAIDYVGPLFVANAVVSALLVVAILIRPGLIVGVAGVAFSVGSLVALVLSRTTGLLGFIERGWTEMAMQVTTAEVGAVVAIAVMMVAQRSPAPALWPAKGDAP